MVSGSAETSEVQTAGGVLSGVQLNDRERAALILRYVDDLPVAEVAAALGTTVPRCRVVARQSQSSRSRFGGAECVDRWIDEVLPGRSPSPEFVARLRNELIDEWQHDGATVRGAMAPRPRRVLPWAVALTAAAALVAAVVVRPDSGGLPRIVPATESTSEGTSISSTTIVLRGAALLDVLSAHRWIQQPYFGMDVLPSARRGSSSIRPAACSPCSMGVVHRRFP